MSRLSPSLMHAFYTHRHTGAYREHAYGDSRGRVPDKKGANSRPRALANDNRRSAYMLALSHVSEACSSM